MSKRLVTLPMLILVFTGLIFSGCGSGTPATPTVTTDSTPGINVTQAEYDAAYARWNALKVQE